MTTCSPWSRRSGPVAPHPPRRRSPRRRPPRPARARRNRRCPGAGHGPAIRDADGRDRRLPGRRRRSPPADDPDAQGHRGPDDARAPGAARLRPDGGRRDAPHGRPRGGQEGVSGEGRHLAELRAVRRQGRGRSARSAIRRSTPIGPSEGLLAKRRINIGVAVAVDDGLLVPVIRDVGHALDPSA